MFVNFVERLHISPLMKLIILLIKLRRLSGQYPWGLYFSSVFICGVFQGSYSLSNFELHGHMNGIQDVIAEKFAKRYDKIVLGSLISFWVIAYKCYKKDKNRFW